jgi:CRP/FNR family cyclic AMP-dependent transcriptional regulator
MRPQDLLRFHPFIGALGQRDAEELMKQAITRRFQVNDVIFRKDDPGTGLYGVVSGRVVVVADSAEGKELILNVFGPGEYFGEIALLDGEGRSATAITREPSELLFLDRMHFMPFLARSPEATTRIIRLLCKRLRRTTDLVEDSIFLPVSLRLAKQLLALVDVYGLQAKDHPTFPVSQGELGRMLGVSREIVARQLAIWRRAGLVEMQRGRITLRDRAALAAMIGNA